MTPKSNAERQAEFRTRQEAELAALRQPATAEVEISRHARRGAQLSRAANGTLFLTRLVQNRRNGAYQADFYVDGPKAGKAMVDLLPPLTDEQLGRLVREVLALETPGSPVADLVKAVR